MGVLEKKGQIEFQVEKLSGKFPREDDPGAVL